jgi:NTP pyrophosphatase (non-canonical NTP hydrolase)
MTLDEYQQKAQSFDLTTGTTNSRNHALFGLAEEVGELLGIEKRLCRGDNQSNTSSKIMAELGDVLWYVAAVAEKYGFNLEAVALNNIDKLEDRRARGKIHGSGDQR